jgi:hypothetical protein
MVMVIERNLRGGRPYRACRRRRDTSQLASHLSGWARAFPRYFSDRLVVRRDRVRRGARNTRSPAACAEQLDDVTARERRFDDAERGQRAR